MRAMFAAFAATIIIAFGANYVLNQGAFSSAVQNSGNDVRLD